MCAVYVYYGVPSKLATLEKWLCKTVPRLGNQVQIPHWELQVHVVGEFEVFLPNWLCLQRKSKQMKTYLQFRAAFVPCLASGSGSFYSYWTIIVINYNDKLITTCRIVDAVFSEKQSKTAKEESKEEELSDLELVNRQVETITESYTAILHCFFSKDNGGESFDTSVVCKGHSLKMQVNIHVIYRAVTIIDCFLFECNR